MAVGFVLFHESNFKEKIDIVAKSGFIIYIYDNSPDSKFARGYIQDEYKNCIRYFTSGVNAGLGVAMSTICAHAYYDKFEALLFFDQDTIFTRETLDFVYQHYRSQPNYLSNYAALSISNDKCHGNAKFEKDVLLIRNSGSLFVLPNLRKIGWFNLNYFVDGVDYEVSLRSSINKYKLALITNVIGFDHEREQGYLLYNFLGIKIKNRKYAFSRISDVLLSTCRLMSCSVINLRFDYLLLIVKNSAVFLMMQVILRLSVEHKG